jgi:uncharacterized protein YjiS (DUF1127 family)
MPNTAENRIFSLATQLGRRAACVLAGWQHRKGLAMLAKFDDRGLADIGLTRSDLYDALARRIWEDPTSMLERRRMARRDNRSGTMRGPATEARPTGQMLGIAGLKRPPVDRPARYLV